MKNGTFKNRSILAKTILVFAYIYVIIGLFLIVTTVLGIVTAFLTYVFTGTAIMVINDSNRFLTLFFGTLIWGIIGIFLVNWLLTEEYRG